MQFRALAADLDLQRWQANYLNSGCRLVSAFWQNAS